MRYVVGIDEAGRGALAGPVCVGAVLAPAELDWQEMYALVTRRARLRRQGEPRLRDSKHLTAQQRDILFDHIISHGGLKHATAFVTADVIDLIGIVNAAHEAAARAITRLGTAPAKVEVLVDAGLRVPSQWSQQSFIRGDETIPAIALASIVAKVTRDRYMEDIAGNYAAYRFDEHKGYGTLAHRRAISQSGLSEMHRTTFCSNLRIRAKSV